jgi:hypothetical protein
VGRVIFSHRALPAAQPVGYLLDGEEVVFRIPEGSALAAVPESVVAFEVDEIDLPARRGWSVLGVGHAYEIVDPRRLAELRRQQPEPAASAAHTITIPLQVLTGSRIRP